ncbi:hypothetical protein B0H13DRAFT_2360906 [Mycena leptocephala]|nr:hypothetical protein B0H13DRAFT_2360906 [Mycena leptocephala]
MSPDRLPPPALHGALRRRAGAAADGGGEPASDARADVHSACPWALRRAARSPTRRPALYISFTVWVGEAILSSLISISSLFLSTIGPCFLPSLVPLPCLHPFWSGFAVLRPPTTYPPPPPAHLRHLSEFFRPPHAPPAPTSCPSSAHLLATFYKLRHRSLFDYASLPCPCLLQTPALTTKHVHATLHRFNRLLHRMGIALDYKCNTVSHLQCVHLPHLVYPPLRPFLLSGPYQSVFRRIAGFARCIAKALIYCRSTSVSVYSVFLLAKLDARDPESHQLHRQPATFAHQYLHPLRGAFALGSDLVSANELATHINCEAERDVDCAYGKDRCPELETRSTIVADVRLNSDCWAVIVPTGAVAEPLEILSTILIIS